MDMGLQHIFLLLAGVMVTFRDKRCWKDLVEERVFLLSSGMFYCSSVGGFPHPRLLQQWQPAVPSRQQLPLGDSLDGFITECPQGDTLLHSLPQYSKGHISGKFYHTIPHHSSSATIQGPLQQAENLSSGEKLFLRQPVSALGEWLLLNLLFLYSLVLIHQSLIFKFIVIVIVYVKFSVFKLHNFRDIIK